MPEKYYPKQCFDLEQEYPEKCFRIRRKKKSPPKKKKPKKKKPKKTVKRSNGAKRKYTDKTCTHGDCEYPIYMNGLCRRHYDRKRNGLDMDKPIKRHKVKYCTVEDCWRPARTRGLCQAHYARWRYRKNRGLSIEDYPLGKIGKQSTIQAKRK